MILLCSRVAWGQKYQRWGKTCLYCAKGKAGVCCLASLVHEKTRVMKGMSEGLNLITSNVDGPDCSL